MPPSPSVQQSPVTQATPSTLGTAGSPLQQTTRPLIANANGSVEATGRRQETTRMRSSIACSSCRRSKTKCDNNGLRDTIGNLLPCKSCTTGNKRCEYPSPQPPANTQPQRRESTATIGGDEVCRKTAHSVLLVELCLCLFSNGWNRLASLLRRNCRYILAQLFSIHTR